MLAIDGRERVRVCRGRMSATGETVVFYGDADGDRGWRGAGRARITELGLGREGRQGKADVRPEKT